jgi:hypothetical protein
MTASVAQSAAVTKSAASASLTTGAITTTTGNGLLYAVVIFAASQDVTGVTDQAGNTWAKIRRVAITSAVAVELWGTTNGSPTGLVAQTITAALSSSQVAVGWWFEIAGGNPSAQVDQAGVGGSASGAALATAATPTLAASNELGLGIFGWSGVHVLTGTPAFTQGTEATSFPSSTGMSSSTGGGNQTNIHVGTLAVTSTTGQAYTGTLSSAEPWGGVVAVLVSASSVTKIQTAKARVKTAVTATQAAHASIAGTTGYSATTLMIEGAAAFEFASEAACAQWVADGVTAFVKPTQRLQGLGGSNTWSGGAGGGSLQAQLVSTGSVANAHAAGATCYLGCYLDNSTIPTILGYWFDTGIGGAWSAGQFATASTTITTTATGVISVPSTAGYSATGGTFKAQSAIGIPSVTVTYLTTVGNSFHGCSVPSGTLAISTASLIDPGAVRVAIQCFAGAAASLGFDGVFVDCEPYSLEHAGWNWDYAGNPNSQSATNTQVLTCGQLFAQWLAAAWALYATGANPVPVMTAWAADGLHFGMSGTVNNNGTPITANQQGTMEEATDWNVNAVGFPNLVETQFWAGFCTATGTGMPSALYLASEIPYRLGNQNLVTGDTLAHLDTLLQYAACTTPAAISQLAEPFSPSGWGYWCDRVQWVPGIWGDGSGTTPAGTEFPINLSELEVALAPTGSPATAGAYPSWTPPGGPVVLYQNSAGVSFVPTNIGAGAGFDYSNGARYPSGSPTGVDYRPPMRNVPTPYLIDPTPPVFGVFSPASGGSASAGPATITGTATTGNAVRSVKYSVNGDPTLGAVLTFNQLTGPAIPPAGTAGVWNGGRTWNTQFSAPLTLVSGTNNVLFTVTAQSGQQTQFLWTANVGNPTKTQQAAARIRATITTAQTAVTRILVNPTVTQTARGRLSTALFTIQGARAHIVNSALTAAQSGLARIQTSVTATQTAAGRVSVASTATQPASGRLLATPTKPQTAVARLSTRVTVTQTAAGRVSQALTVAQAAKGRLSTAPTRTQTARARISTGVSKTQTAVARLISATQPTAFQTARARIYNPSNLTIIQAGRGRVSKPVTVTQSAHGRVQIVSTATQNGHGRVRIVPTVTQTARARIAKALTATQIAKSRIFATPTKPQTARGRVQITPTAVQRGRGRLTNTVTTTQTAVARVVPTPTKTQTAHAYIVAGAATPTFTFGRVQVRWGFFPPTIRWRFGKDA